ncbi:MAG: glycoside hydrolase family 30 protein [Solirubrobacteraceae bacterium]
MRISARPFVIAFALLLAPAPAAAARNIAVSVTQTSADLSQALTSLPRLPFKLGVPSRRLRVITVNDARRFQTMQGFGAAMTDTSAWLIWDALTPHQRGSLMQKLFGVGPGGIGVSYVRVPIGASDFTRGRAPYSYDDLPSGQSDPTLANFSIAHDEAYILPALRAMRAINPAVTTLASEWSPPPWMKANDSFGNPGPPGGSLLTANYPVLAAYFVRFLSAYAAAGVPIQAITPQNEPDQLTNYPGMVFTESQEAQFIGSDLMPALHAANLDPAILGYDFEWSCRGSPTAVPCDLRYPAKLAADPVAGAGLAGIAWHCYAGNADEMSLMHALAPRLAEVLSECTSGRLTPGPPAQLEIAAARNWAGAVVLWNLALDPRGGPVEPPNWGCGGCIGLVRVNEKTHRFGLTRDYYQLGQASRYVRPGAVRIASNTFVTDQNTYLRSRGSYTSPGLDDVAFLDPNGTRVLLAYNSGRSPARFAVRWRGSYFSYTLAPRAMATFRWSPAAGGGG